MGDSDIIEEGTSTNNQSCEYRDIRRDCDGDWDYYCHKYSGTCPYMKCVQDVDRDIVQLCRK